LQEIREPGGKENMTPVRPMVKLEVKYFRAYRSGVIRDGVIRSINGL